MHRVELAPGPQHFLRGGEQARGGEGREKIRTVPACLSWSREEGIVADREQGQDRFAGTMTTRDRAMKEWGEGRKEKREAAEDGAKLKSGEDAGRQRDDKSGVGWRWGSYDAFVPAAIDSFSLSLQRTILRALLRALSSGGQFLRSLRLRPGNDNGGGFLPLGH